MYISLLIKELSIKKGNRNFEKSFFLQKFVFVGKTKVTDFLNSVLKTRNFEFKENKYAIVDRLK